MIVPPQQDEDFPEQDMCEEAQRWSKLGEKFDVFAAFNAKHLNEDIEGDAPLPNTWIKERIRNYNVALVLALNCDVDPPDVTKPSPCARLQAWYDPTGKNPQHAVNQIGSNLQKQYEAWQPRARYKLCLDPTVEDVKKLCQSMRRGAKEDRVVFHYNGHGVPRPTENGEIWVFNKNYTQYIPLSIYDLQSWMGAPSVYVFDCHNAERIIKAYFQFCEKRKSELPSQTDLNILNAGPETVSSGVQTGIISQDGEVGNSGSNSAGAAAALLAAAARRSHTTLCMENTIIFAACREREQLPLNPEMPADLFTSCLTTPIKVALRFYFMEYRNILPGIVSEELLLRVPGVMTDRRTMLGEIYWLFAAITDSIAWNSMSIDLFQRLFRQDIITASLARNFLLAQRVMYYFECNPVCWPNLPPMQTHRLWQSWDGALEQYLLQLPKIITNVHLNAGLTAANALTPMMPANAMTIATTFEHTKFFEEQLTAFELWLNTSSEKKGLAAQLPVILQVLLSQNHRIRALDLLGRFVDQGKWAMNQALLLGMFPYVVRLLQSRTTEVRPCLTFLWSKILAFCDLEDNYVRQEIIKDKGFGYFLEVIQDSSLNPDVKTRAVFVLARILDGQRHIREALLTNNIVNTLLEQLDMCDHRLADNKNLKLWLILCLSQLWSKNDNARWYGVRYNVHERLYDFLKDVNPVVRAATVYALGTYVDNAEEGVERSDHANTIDHNVGITLAQTCLTDASPLVRRELVVAFSGLVRQFESQFIAIGCQYIEEMSQAQISEPQPSQSSPHLPTKATGRHGSVDFGRGLLQFLNSVTGGAAASSSTVASPAAASPPAASLPPPPSHARLVRERHSLTPMSSAQILNMNEMSIEDQKLGGSENVPLYNGSTSGGIRRIASTNMFFTGAASSLGGNVYAQLWKALMVLTNDPSSEVNKMAKLIIVNIKNKISGKSAAVSEQRAAALIELNQRSTTSITSIVSRNSTTIATPSRRQTYESNRSAPGTPSQSPSRRSNRNSPPQRTQTTPLASAVGGQAAAPLIHSAQFPSRKHFADLPAAPAAAAPGQATPGLSRATTTIGDLAAELAKVKTELFAWCSARFREPVYSCPPERDPLSPPYQARVIHLQEQSENRTRLSREWMDSTPLSEQVFVQRTNFRCHLLRFHPHHDHLAAAERKSVFIWNWEACQLRQTLLLKPHSDTRCITALHFVNPHEERGLLMTGCDDGSVRIYRNYFPDMGQDPEVITAWMALSDMLSSNRRSGLVSAWTQTLGQLAVSGDVKYVRLWDTEREAALQDIPTNAPSCVTCMERTADGHVVAVGQGDGFVRLLDANRSDPSSACIASLNIDCSWVHSVRVCQETNELWTLASDGQVRTFDLRSLSTSMAHPVEVSHTVQLDGVQPTTASTIGGSSSASSLTGPPLGGAHTYNSSTASSLLTGSHTCWDMHLGARLAAVGRVGQYVTVHSLRTGRTINTIKYYEGLLGQRIGAPIAIAFHPVKMVFGVSTADEYITVFSTPKRP